MQPVGQESVNTEVHFDETIVCFLSISIQVSGFCVILSVYNDRCQADVRLSSGSHPAVVKK